MTDGTEPEPTIESLLQANQELRTELDELKEQIEAERKAVRRVGWFGLKVFVGGDLRRSFRAWMNADWKPFPRDETADLAASLVRRLVRVSLVGLAVAVVPTALLVWQNWEIRRQSELFREQLDQQVRDTTIVRRSQLLATIYDCTKTEPSPEPPPEIPVPTQPVPKICPPKAHPRARSEAVRAFAAIEEGRGVRIVLASADLSGLSLNQVDLTKAMLYSADLHESEFFQAVLTGAGLYNADLSGAILYQAHLQDADLQLANLTHANLSDADLSGALLYGADISGAGFYGADLTRVQGLFQAQIDSAFGNTETKLPGNLVRPRHWLESERGPERD